MNIYLNGDHAHMHPYINTHTHISVIGKRFVANFMACLLIYVYVNECNIFRSVNWTSIIMLCVIARTNRFSAGFSANFVALKSHFESTMAENNFAAISWTRACVRKSTMYYILRLSLSMSRDNLDVKYCPWEIRVKCDMIFVCHHWHKITFPRYIFTFQTRKNSTYAHCNRKCRNVEKSYCQIETFRMIFRKFSIY